MSAAQAWENLVRAAMLGTERQPPEHAATGDPALDGTLAALVDRPAEARVLGTAALLDAWRRAGQRPTRIAAPLPPPAPDQAERMAPPVAARVLRQILADGSAPLLVEWLALAGARGLALPHELLPAVLDLGARQAAAREAIAGALGARGRWLAARNPAWGYAGGVADDLSAGWETGTAEERLRILRHQRATDPAGGLALLRTTWATEAPRDRAAFVEALAAGLSMDDEPFLESLLDDKRKEVRTTAARLLATLPQSRLVARMVERLAPLLHVAKPEGVIARLRGGPVRIAIDLPAACDKGMQRDGIEAKPPAGTGERTWWLRQMVTSIPPSVWTARWEMDAAALLAAARAAGDEGAVLVRGWRDATVATHDAQWAEALLSVRGDEGAGAVSTLAAAVPGDRLEPIILSHLRKRLDAPGIVLGLLHGATWVWNPALTHAVVSAVPNPMPPFEYTLREQLRGFALYMHPATAISILHAQGDPHEGKWVELLHLRATLHHAFE
ncbi:MAG TPA: DUF5691 domain-containing protein [Longimicrobium sp.]|nr:DUF5691 domain-containing protein [Longimicrobium sp.]